MHPESKQQQHSVHLLFLHPSISCLKSPLLHTFIRLINFPSENCLFFLLLLRLKLEVGTCCLCHQMHSQPSLLPFLLGVKRKLSSLSVFSLIICEPSRPDVMLAVNVSASHSTKRGIYLSHYRLISCLSHQGEVMAALLQATRLPSDWPQFKCGISSRFCGDQSELFSSYFKETFEEFVPA